MNTVSAQYPTVPQYTTPTPTVLPLPAPNASWRFARPVTCPTLASHARSGRRKWRRRRGCWLLAEYMAESGAKACGNCGTILVKSEGCNHMQCGGCKIHICWVCDEMSETGELRDQNGNFKGWIASPHYTMLHGSIKSCDPTLQVCNQVSGSAANNYYRTGLLHASWRAGWRPL